MTYDEALSCIHSLSVFPKKASLERIAPVLHRLSDPQDSIPTIHVAGTDGKGSVCAYLSEIFRDAGYKTGLYISPYITDFRERIQINGKMIEKKSLAKLIENIFPLSSSLTEFELVTASAFRYFADEKCDIAIIETGLGGRFDATNAIACPMVSVITSISLDHTAILGGTIEEIAAEKCGIIKNSPVVTSPGQDERALGVIRDSTKWLVIPQRELLKKITSDIFGNTYIYKGAKYHTRMPGDFQIDNSITAIEAAMLCKDMLTSKNIMNGIAKASLPARCEVMSENPLIVLDGAHNPAAAEALCRVMLPYSGRITALVGMMSDKDCDSVLKFTLPLCKNVVVTKPNNLPRAAEAEALAEIAGKYNKNILCVPEPMQALNTAKALSSGEPLFIFGSLYLAGAVRPALSDI